MILLAPPSANSKGCASDTDAACASLEKPTDARYPTCGASSEGAFPRLGFTCPSPEIRTKTNPAGSMESTLPWGQPPLPPIWGVGLDDGRNSAVRSYTHIAYRRPCFTSGRRWFTFVVSRPKKCLWAWKHTNDNSQRRQQHRQNQCTSTHAIPAESGGYPCPIPGPIRTHYSLVFTVSGPGVAKPRHHARIFTSR